MPHQPRNKFIFQQQQQQRRINQNTEVGVHQDNQQIPRRLEDHLKQLVTESEYATMMKFARRVTVPGKDVNPLVLLIVLQAETVHRVLLQLAEQRAWIQSTLMSKIASVLACAKRYNMSPQIIETLKAVMQGQKMKEPAWFPTQELTPRYLAPMLMAHRCMEFCFLTGQRVSDVLRIKQKNCFVVKQHNFHSVGVVLTSGKVVMRTGPWTLHLPWGSRAHQLLTNTTQWGKTPYAFLEVPTLLTHAEETKMIEKVERQIKQSFPMDLRTPRRAGLSTAALCSDLNLQDMLLVSRHPSVETLRIYLAAGLLDRHAMEVHHKFVATTEKALSERHTFSVSPLEVANTMRSHQ